MFNPHPPSGLSLRITERSNPCSPHPARCRVMSHRWILEFLAVLYSGGVLSFSTCAQPAPGSGCGCLCSTPVQSQKHFTTRQLNASFHAQKGGVCCKPATFPSSHSPLSKSIVCLKFSPLTRDYWRVGVFSISLFPWTVLSGRFF